MISLNKLDSTLLEGLLQTGIASCTDVLETFGYSLSTKEKLLVTDQMLFYASLLEHIEEGRDYESIELDDEHITKRLEALNKLYYKLQAITDAAEDYEEFDGEIN